MKNFWLFAYRVYYPSGGMNDLIEKFESLEDSLIYFEKWKGVIGEEAYAPLEGMDIAYIYDISTGTKIKLDV